ncbi:EVE domain-containing protein [bacterium]|nr:EVE domain-containing protein [bacterium]
MNYWILKTEPSTYSIDDLIRDKKTVWDGVKNPYALHNIRSMQKGDQLMIYHTGDEKCIVGLAEAVSTAYPDPKHADLSVIEIQAIKKFAKTVTLKEIKADSQFKDLKLVRQPRLSVGPVPEAIWKVLLKKLE